jgi:hypothetical protein
VRREHREAFFGTDFLRSPKGKVEWCHQWGSTDSIRQRPLGSSPIGSWSWIAVLYLSRE